MALIIGAILALLSIAVAVYPFVSHRFFAARRPPPAAGQGSLAARLDAVYDAINTLQLERELGNLPEGLYREQLDAYRFQAALLLREMDRSSAERGEDWALEEEIRLARTALKLPALEPPLPCPACGRPTRAEGNQCPECGGSLTASVPVERPVDPAEPGQT